MNNNKFTPDINHKYGFDLIHQKLNAHIHNTFLIEHRKEPVYNEFNQHNPYTEKHKYYTFQPTIINKKEEEEETLSFDKIYPQENKTELIENILIPKMSKNYKSFLKDSKSIQW